MKYCILPYFFLYSFQTDSVKNFFLSSHLAFSLFSFQGTIYWIPSEIQSSTFNLLEYWSLNFKNLFTIHFSSFIIHSTTGIWWIVNNEVVSLMNNTKNKTRFAPFVFWWAQVDSNHRPHAYQACALTTWAMSPFSRFRDFGGASPSKSEPFGRASMPSLAQSFGTDWVSSPSTGGDERDRTDDPLLAKQVLSQLSYTPV